MSEQSGSLGTQLDDLEKHGSEAAIKAALEKLAAYAAYLKILGSYPVAVY